jgi:predicted SAM-dependent methyltransferase
MNIKYFPVTDDTMWNNEVSKILPYCDGKGLDIGAGARSINKEIKRLDIDPKKEPDILCSGDNIKVPDNTFDFIVAQHALEHFEDQEKTIKEWLRVVKPGGYINIIHPDVQYTKPQKEVGANPSLQKDPYNKHYHERTLLEFVKWISSLKRLGFAVIAYGEAQMSWSFYCILRKLSTPLPYHEGHSKRPV